MLKRSTAVIDGILTTQAAHQPEEISDDLSVDSTVKSTGDTDGSERSVISKTGSWSLYTRSWNLPD